MHEFFVENLRNSARNRRAGPMRQFCPGQLDSTRSPGLSKRATTNRWKFISASIEPPEKISAAGSRTDAIRQISEKK
jgi:hypothetical protein